MIPVTADYALRVVAYLAGRGGAAATGRDIARQTKVPGGYLTKVMAGLTRAGLVGSQRGIHGGYRLLVPPEKVSVHAVLTAVEAIGRRGGGHRPAGLPPDEAARLAASFLASLDAETEALLHRTSVRSVMSSG